MEQVNRFWKGFREFDNDSDYFWLVDSICCIFEQRPPLSKRFAIKAVWTALSVFHGFQYLCFTVQLFRCLSQTPVEVEKLTAIANMHFILTVAILRGLCLAYHRDAFLELKQYINSKSCRRDDLNAFEIRKSMHQKINRYVAVFHLFSLMNSCTWAFTTGMYEDVFKIPFLVTGLPHAWKKMLDTCFVILQIPWCFTVWYSPTQFVSMLSILRTELSLIDGQFEGLFEKVVANYALQPNDLDGLPMMQRTRFWAELDKTFKCAISHHSTFIRKLQLLRNVSSLNFFIFLCSSAVIITLNIYLFITDPSIGRLPLQLLALQFVSETYLCCTMFDNLEAENNRITNYVHAIDWLYSTGKRSSSDRMYCKSIFQNAIILHQQVHKGLTIQAGGMFSLNLSTFTNLMKSVYSLLTLLLQSV